MEPSYLLTIIWAVIIAVAVFGYVVLDGFDLGIGILFPWFGVGEERDQAMNAIAPVWDGNETWLVLGGGGLLAAFPLAYAIIMPAIYPPIIAMLLGLVFRGVAFEFRWRDPGHRAFWDFAFTGGSLIAALAQGITLGALLQGVKVASRAYAGGWLDWLAPFSVLTGVSVAVGYALLGATWLIWKLEGRAQDHAYRLATRSAIGTLVAMAAVSIATLFLTYHYYTRWLDFPGVLFTAQVPLASAIIAATLFWSLNSRREVLPFLCALGLFLLGFIGLAVSMFPYVIPPSVTIWDAATTARGQVFMLVGVALTLPFILGYTGWAYWVFRGKVGAHGYH